VSDGALSFYHDRFVRTRVSKFTYGIFGDIEFNPADSDHKRRLPQAFTHLSGDLVIPDCFDVILPKVCLFFFVITLLISLSTQNTQVSETKEFRRSYFRIRESKDEFKSFTRSIWCYRGAVVMPKWKDVDTRKCMVFETMKYYLTGSIENYTELCTIEVDLSHLPLSPQPQVSGEGIFYRLSFDIVLLFGQTELEAAVAWKEKVGPLLVLLLSHIFIYTILSGY
jgi:hypothetical protein